MKLNDAKEVRQTNNVGETNKLLSEGFQLYKILSEQKTSGEILPVYILIK